MGPLCELIGSVTLAVGPIVPPLRTGPVIPYRPDVAINSPVPATAPHSLPIRRSRAASSDRGASNDDAGSADCWRGDASNGRAKTRDRTCRVCSNRRNRSICKQFFEVFYPCRATSCSHLSSGRKRWQFGGVAKRLANSLPCQAPTQGCRRPTVELRSPRVSEQNYASLLAKANVCLEWSAQPIAPVGRVRSGGDSHVH